MTEPTLVPLLDGGGFFECPRWRDGRWWVSDFYREAVYTVTSDGAEELIVEVDAPARRARMASRRIAADRLDEGPTRAAARSGRDVSVHADLSAFTDSSLNDMVVDEHGRAWIGCFGFDLMSFADPRLAPLMRVDPDGTATLAAERPDVPQRVGDHAGRHHVDRRRDRRLSLHRLHDPRRRVADRPPRLGAAVAHARARLAGGDGVPDAVAPDGCTLDAEGHIWAADEAGARCIRVAPGGAIVDEIPTPEGLGCFACALGGDDGRTLLVCAAPDFLERTAARPVRRCC